MENHYPQTPIDKLVQPVQRFIQEEKSGGLLLGISVMIALVLANTPLSHAYHEFLDQSFGLTWNNKIYFNYSIHHWINDGLMSIFFFVVGLELKREIIGGELSNPRKALLPIVAAVGGMLIPALIYLAFNPSGEPHKGWGIPMATDIAFALGVLYLLGNRIPLALKVFLTALAIVDDLGAVLVIAFFYTSEISIGFLLAGLLILLFMYLGNKLGIRSIIFYAVLGICGVWATFLVSGVHATIAAVLAAFTIPADVKIKENIFISKINVYLERFKNIDPTENTPTLTNEQLHVLEKMNEATLAATPPLQRLEHAMHPAVSFLIIPVFAIANAGVSLNIDPAALLDNNIALGTALGLLAGKVLGVVGFSMAFIKLKIAKVPEGMNFRNLLGLGFLASIGFTMSLFITSLAFSHEEYQTQAKIGIFAASLIGGITGYIILSRNSQSAGK
ncbi:MULTISPECIES: Na+/H+ antiporter NhaA [Chryseobacterium]|uniref:Na(+)/H(+) antiporter NhaA n=1 Tax=Chryseobacterium camelliae TaxID=1265445 RepID=A0ABU0TI25_9FLAO|nr:MULTISPECIES: Na+/H+ antiporter NhaA [Chryseobacterium]MDT3409428.1 NhaA family Na+:H+ antiporter [Pseudacidovorax intermedius]MDQ1096707.1 NhaA family Na+:H+ antiporter [Chryseobacterium camelliae]MDQ1100651.1 NhaA family Na+:H+ antiporter [Chryseobacterium sp. SORGH_AS_1048]MDR6087989.1 NhaA family Na+:H+ antiporter [Chryseobacterium sp. SORGH_AS_0909]MDR6132364.1 NhaA family Na+:H+ antiporter [Chryseobacterium sp. SORGH_AS_1175]